MKFETCAWLSVACLLTVATGCEESQTPVPGKEPSSARSVPGAISPDRLPAVPGPKVENVQPKAPQVTGELLRKAGTQREESGAVVRAVSELPRVSAEKELSVSRLVISRAIEHREPVRTASFTTDGEAVFAFVELGNSGKTERDIVVTFEHESGKKVGFIALSVPGDQKRWRTWGRTAQIKEAGKWTAVVSVKEGPELSRESFDVSHAEGVASGS